ncbi:MAG: hypothetical protein M3Y36_02215 [Actinomycetota bacterium]|nr:hypothetical protein [Actinomycetota bacterium]
MTDKQESDQPSWTQLILSILGSLAVAALAAWAFVVVVSYILNTTPCQRMGTC